MTAFANRLPKSSTGWLLLLAGAGVFIAAADQTCVVAVLPKMTDDLGLAQDQFYRAAWIVNGYILGYVVAMPLMARISDAAGHGRIFACSLLVFIVGSVWVALSNDLTVLCIARAFQAVGGGAVVPVALAIVIDNVAPERRALGLGAMAAAAEAGGLLGPLWGGGITALAGWRVLFWINLPLCLPLAVAVWRLAPRQRLGSLRDIDFLGAGLLGVCLVALTVALTDDPIAPRAAGVTLALYAAAALVFAAFVLRQARARSPIFELSRLRRLPISAGFLTNLLVGGALLAAMVSVPLFTNVVLLEGPFQGGLNLMRLSVALPVGALAGGYLANRIGYGATGALALACAGAGFLAMTRWTSSPDFLPFTLPLLLAGLGFGLAIAPVNAAVLDEVEGDERATMASLLTVLRLLGALVSVALLTTRGLGGFYAAAGAIPLSDPRFLSLVASLQVDTFHRVFVVTAAVCFATVLPALCLSRGIWGRSRHAEPLRAGEPID